ncbi:MarR family winged helix-turn-helix transcriptional regulator [Lacticaseibacillus daqingensis]|uniref:MarR family winged helix-turn-helix transcriptional regulator n=1 Tax=Lacticaseibacillus daqingensis TaxID=2486014 RepID=UPI000F7843C3|nr:MarR family transcriptional regulator [Lacticaseibacillus daqingensis]
MTSQEAEKRINGKLEAVYKDILWLEEAELKKSRFKDLSIKEMHTIDAIGLHAEPSSATVARRLHVTAGTLTVAVKNLVRKGYVERRHEQGDGRVVNLALTRKGRLMYRAHAAYHQKMVASFVTGFNDHEVGLIESALDNLLSFLATQR